MNISIFPKAHGLWIVAIVLGFGWTSGDAFGDPRCSNVRMHCSAGFENESCRRILDGATQISTRQCAAEGARSGNTYSDEDNEILNSWVESGGSLPSALTRADMTFSPNDPEVVATQGAAPEESAPASPPPATPPARVAPPSSPPIAIATAGHTHAGGAGHDDVESEAPVTTNGTGKSPNAKGEITREVAQANTTEGSKQYAMDDDGGLQNIYSYSLYRQGGRGRCGFSTRAGYADCEATKALAQASDFSVQALEGVGAMAVQTTGTLASASAQDPNATVGDVYGGAQTTAIAAATANNTTGITAAALGAALLSRASEHGSIEGRMREVRDNGSVNVKRTGSFQGEAVAGGEGQTKEDSAKLIERFQINRAARMTAASTAVLSCNNAEYSKAQKQACRNQAEARQQVALIDRTESVMGSAASRVEDEQRAAKNQATMAGMKMLLQSAASLAKGALATAAAVQLGEAQDDLEDEEGQDSGFDDSDYQFDPLAGDPTGPAGGGPGIDPGDSRLVASGATGDDEDEDFGLGELPVGNDNLGADRTEGPAPGILAFSPGGGPGAGGGGSAGGVGSTSASGDEADSSAATAEASNAKSNAAYAGGRGRRRRGGGGGGGNGASVGGLDMNSLLAQFLPGKEEKKEDEVGLMNFGEGQKGGRQPASLLGRNVNIFETIERAYKKNTRLGRVGT